ncbi:Alpha/Beta hydrolase protein [Xylogone sp. PMI_703]|nr:Alpha/Beta hydrolase protein [Xylogone sp. PMI_703]
MALNWIKGRTDTAFHHSEKLSPILATKRQVDTDWHSFCKDVIPPCHLNPWLFNGHLQTFAAFFDNANSDIPIYYKRWIFQQEIELFRGEFAIDFVVGPNNDHEDNLPSHTTQFTEEEFSNIGSLDSKPMLIVMHGVSGGSHELYLRRTLAAFAQHGNEWEFCVVNSRGCAHSKLTSGLLYNARSTWDLRQTVKWIRKTFPKRPLFGLGFSMGANILTHYLAEEGAACPLNAAVVVSNPWNLVELRNHLESSIFMRQVYSRGITSALRKYMYRHVDQISTNPGFDPNDIPKIQYLYQFDRTIQTCIWHYPNESIYYREASSVAPLLDVKIPVLILNAEDDPLSPYAGLPFKEAKENPFVTLVTTSRGGHLGWFQADGSRWFVEAVYNMLQGYWENVELKHLEEGDTVEVKEVEHRPNRFCYKCGRWCKSSIEEEYAKS